MMEDLPVVTTAEATFSSLGRAYDSYLDFYRGTYGHAIREVRPAGRVGASMIAAEQDAGDWSDAPSPDLVVNVLAKHTLYSEIDVGAGRFRGRHVPGLIVIVPPNVATTFLADGRHAISSLAIPYPNLLTLVGEGQDLPSDGDFGSLHAGVVRSPEIVGTMDRLWRESRSDHPYGALGADSLLLYLAAQLLRLRQSGLVRQERGGLAPWQVRRVTEFMRENLHRDVGLVELATLARVSTHHFCRAFRASFGVPPSHWFMQRRIERAQELMAGSPIPLSEVASAVGYRSQGAFGTAFRKVTGTTPARWRREWSA